MNDIVAAALITISMIPLGIGIAYGRDIAACAWTAMRKRRRATPGYATLNAWPCDASAMTGAEISAPVIAEASQIAEYAWYTWEPEQVEEGEE